MSNSIKNTPNNPVKSNFMVGDTVIVNYRIIEGEKSRLQPYEGIVISIRGAGVSKTFTVRRVTSGGIGVERIFQLFSPNIDSVTVKTRGKVRKAKLYYMRDRKGKAARRVKEKKETINQNNQSNPAVITEA